MMYLFIRQCLPRLVSRGTSTVASDWSYKSLIVIQYSLPAILLAGVFFFPESAYFLIKKGKIEDAKKAFRRMYGSKDPEFLDIELKRITENVRFSEALKKEAALGGPLISQCFRGTNLVIPCRTKLIAETYYDGDYTAYCATMDWRILFRWLYITLIHG